ACSFVGTEMLLLGLVGEGTGIAAQVLDSLGVGLTNARVEVEKIVDQGSGFVPVEIPFSGEADNLLQLAMNGVKQLGHDFIDTEHLLAGILLLPLEDKAVQVLVALNVNLSLLRDQLLQAVSAEPILPAANNKPTRSHNKQLLKNLSKQALEVMHQAEDETCSLDHRFVGTGQILLRLLKEKTGLAAQALNSSGLDLRTARATLEKIIGRGPGTGFVGDGLPFTPRTIRVLEYSHEQARRMGSESTDTEHLLLGLLQQDEDVAILVLVTLGIDPRQLEEHLLSSNASPSK
ncbi:MAG: hypothetical protein H7Y22_01880, partial [Gemmatimonadaceae bacterium]|nr:hypothetical protein [Gloeobacterales cyanobacterium ES-bin-141]